MTDAWWDRRITTLDLETTAADPQEARIVTAAIAYVGGGKPLYSQEIVCAVEVEIPDEAAAIHGWSTERARREGMPFEDALDIVFGHVDQRPEGSPVVIFNAPYDLTVLDREARRAGVGDLLESAPQPLLVVDPLVTDKFLGRYRKGSRRLGDMCRTYGVRLDFAHQAQSDAISAARLAYQQAKHGMVVRRVYDAQTAMERDELQRYWDSVRFDLDRLHAAQEGWALEQQRGLQEYFIKGNPKKGVPPQPERIIPLGWPLIPIAEEAKL